MFGQIWSSVTVEDERKKSLQHTSGKYGKKLEGLEGLFDK